MSPLFLAAQPLHDLRQRIRQLREEKSGEAVREFLRRMAQMGCTREEVRRLLEKHGSDPPDGEEG